MDTFKVCLIGDGGVGKTSLRKRNFSGEFEQKYVATLGVEVYPLQFATNHGNFCINLWDCAGQEKFGGLRDGYFAESHGAIVMFNLTSIFTFKHIEFWIQTFKRVVPNAPVILCGNKCDMKNKKVTHEMIRNFMHKNPEIPYFEISAKSMYQYDKPFFEILKNLTGHEDLNWII